MSGFGYDYCTHPDLSGRKPKYHPCDTLGHANPSADALCDASGRVVGQIAGADEAVDVEITIGTLGVGTVEFVGARLVAKEEGGLIIGKMGDLASENGWRDGDFTLNLPPQQGIEAQWAQNARELQYWID